MRHLLKRKYADRQKINISDHSQNEYRRTQKYKTGWRARWGKFKDRLVKILSICFLIMVPIVNIYIRFFYDGISENSIYGLWQSENHKLAISYNEGGRSRKNGYNYLNMYVRKDHYLTYNDESYKRIDDRDKTITWKDGSTSVYGERKTFFDYFDSFLFWGMVGAAFLSTIVIGWRNIKSKKVRKKSP